MAAKTAFSDRHFAGIDRPGSQSKQSRNFVWSPSRRVADAAKRAAAQIHAIGVGRKYVSNERTNTASVRVYVTQKLPKSIVPPEARVPELIDGVPTDVVEAPPAFLAMPPAPSCSLRRTRTQRPMRGGISGSNVSVNAGTLAALCRSTRASEHGQLFLLGPNHTLADLGAVPIGASVTQPSPRDGGTEAERIGGLARFVPIHESDRAENLADAALALLDAGIEAELEICSIGRVRGTAPNSSDRKVAKHGRTTGLTFGVIDDLSVDVVVPLSRSDLNRVARFVRQIRIRPTGQMTVFAQAGDSGALVVSRDGNHAIGLLFACPDNGSYAYANPIERVLELLDAELA